MDMDSGAMGASMSNSTMTMSDLMAAMMSMSQFHATGGDTLWISPFIPSSSASIFGACVLLFFVAMLSRFIEAIQRTSTLIWAASVNTGSPVSWKAFPEIPRGALFLLQSGILYLLMLAVMTYNAYYFVSILIGLGVGEASFGRFGRPVLQCSSTMSASPVKDPGCCEKDLD